MAEAPHGTTSALQTTLEDIYDFQEDKIRKQLPKRFPNRNFDIYVTTKTSFKTQLNRCKRLFGAGQSSIYIHSIGSGIPVALNLALQLQKSLGDRVGIETATSFVELSDDFEPLKNNGPSKCNSAVHLKVSFPSE